MSGDRPAGPRSPASAPPAPIIDAHRVEGLAAWAPLGEFTYSVTIAPPRAPKRSAAPMSAKPLSAAASAPPAEPAAGSTDKRRVSRQRTKLRTGKILDAAGHLVSDCLIFDRSPMGSRLRLPPGVALKTRFFQFYDDQHGLLQQADIVWRLNRDIGVRFRPVPASQRSRALEADLRRRFQTGPK